MSNDVDEGRISNLMAMMREVPDTCVGEHFFFRGVLLYSTDYGVSRPMMGHCAQGNLKKISERRTKPAKRQPSFSVVPRSGARRNMQ